MFRLDDKQPEMFEFEYKGKKHSLPTIDSLPFATFMRLRKKLSSSENAEEIGFDEIMSLFEQYIPDVMSEITIDQARQLFVAYAGSAKTSLGE